MIIITDKHKCCGCSACAQVCPQQCISFVEDEKGFRYPQVGRSLCINCGLCEKVCPFLHVGEPRNPLEVFAAVNPNEEIRMKSSSGGVFTLLAESVIDEGGVVFGARFNKQWGVIHDYTEAKEGLAPFRGSKYVQSFIGDCYQQAKHFLQLGRKVLFSGTPCQIAGLKNFLGKEYDNLLAVDLVCHGVPSPLVWEEYLKTIPAPRVDGKNLVSLSLNEMPVITGISFRDKRNGWQKFGFSAQMSAPKADKNTVIQHYEPKDKNPYLKGFLSNVFLRPSCYKCHFKQGCSRADITLADYWGAKKEHPGIFDDKGVSCVISFSEKGLTVINSLILIKEVSTIQKFTDQNPAYIKPHAIPANRNKFWSEFHRNGIMVAIDKYAKQSHKEHLRSLVIVFIGKLGLVGLIKKLLNK